MAVGYFFVHVKKSSVPFTPIKNGYLTTATTRMQQKPKPTNDCLSSSMPFMIVLGCPASVYKTQVKHAGNLPKLHPAG